VIKDANISIISCDVVDIFRGKQISPGKKSITFHIEVLNPNLIIFVESLLSRLGGKMR
jgi:ferredoxin-fold anticodon binding domain-containing protein